MPGLSLNRIFPDQFPGRMLLFFQPKSQKQKQKVHLNLCRLALKVESGPDILPG